MMEPQANAKVDRESTPASPGHSVIENGLIVRALRCRPSALLSDIDGTLSPIAAVPAEAVVLESCRAALARLAEAVDLVSILSGRPVAEARHMVGLDQLTYFGNHGLERWDPEHGVRSEADAFVTAIAEALQQLEAQLRGMPGVLLEDKRVVVSIHYRLAPDEPTAREELLAIATNVAFERGLVVTQGKKVIELRPPVAVDKGAIVHELIKEYGLNGVVYIGDDVTDIDAFRALLSARESGVRTVLVAVGGSEAREELLSLADLRVDGPPAVGELLQGLAQELASTQSLPGEPGSS